MTHHAKARACCLAIVLVHSSCARGVIGTQARGVEVTVHRLSECARIQGIPACLAANEGLIELEYEMKMEIEGVRCGVGTRAGEHKRETADATQCETTSHSRCHWLCRGAHTRAVNALRG